MGYAIEVKDAYINYVFLKSFSIKKSLTSFGKNKPQTFTAVKGVSFNVEEGDIVGIVGKNGSGKSTLLRAIAGVFAVDQGSIDLNGHTVSLMAIGVGFQKNLSGRENIYLSGMLLGFSKETIDERIKEIIEFSELGEFIDRPVKTYSSGMHSKLAFSINTIMQTDILLVDEVLSVGDAKFKKKSFEKMKTLIVDKNRTVLIVSHNSKNIRELCNKVLWLHDGNVKMYGDVNEVMDQYDEFMK